MPAAGRILRDGQAIPNRNIGKRSLIYIYSYTRTYTPPIEVAQDDRINFRTNSNTADATNNSVSLLIELDM